MILTNTERVRAILALVVGVMLCEPLEWNYREREWCRIKCDRRQCSVPLSSITMKVLPKKVFSLLCGRFNIVAFL